MDVGGMSWPKTFGDDDNEDDGDDECKSPHFLLLLYS